MPTKIRPTKEEFKSILGVGLLTLIVFGSIIIYRGYEVEPELNATYSEIYGLNEEGDEWE